MARACFLEDVMKVVAGLGNPGRKYEGTRHNVGFDVVDELSRRWRIETTRQRFSSLVGDGLIRDERVVLLKPQTYMNLSGRAVREAMTFYKLEATTLLVVVDDMALPLGRLRMRPKGSGGSHNGLNNVIGELDTEDFARLRVGIGAVSSEHAVSYVLGSFDKQERACVDETVIRAADAVECWVAEGVEAVMNRYNRPEEQASSE
jgi:PTH1 family peptidyl-tRNA hydrolase